MNTNEGVVLSAMNVDQHLQQNLKLSNYSDKINKIYPEFYGN